MSDIGPHLGYLTETVILHNAKRVIELGTRRGGSTGALLIGVAETQGHLWSIDPDGSCGNQVLSFYGELASQRWTFIHGHSHDEEVLRLLRATVEPYDLIFIDSSHEAEQTQKELVYYNYLLKKGGRMILHDTDPRNDYWWAGVRQPVYAFLCTHREYHIERDVIHSEGMLTLAKL